ncbi:MAG: glycoside hydrolase family 97 protein [Bacteroidota bacterium]
MKQVSFLFLSLFILVASCSQVPDQYRSPDGRISVQTGTREDVPFAYKVLKDGEVVVGSSAIELEFRNQEPFSGGLRMELVSRSSVDETWEPLWGKCGKVRNHYNEYIFSLSEQGQDPRYLEWIIRIFDDGVAFRYRFPEGSGFGAFSLTDERTSFNLDPSVKVWATNHVHYFSSQEHTFDERTVGQIGVEEMIGCPLLAELNPGSWVLITEADLTDWGGLYFRAGKDQEASLVSSLSSLKRDPAVKVESEVPAVSPWRVIMVGDSPGVFIESNIIANLNDPVEYDDVSWIRPGVSAWDRWWSGDYGPDAGFKLGMNTATMKYFVDLADRMDWEYMIVDWTWYGEVFAEGGGPNPAADITTSVEEVDIPGIIAYANERDVDIILWVLSQHLDRQMDEALALYELWGAAGIKVDFMDAEDQDMVNWYHKVARKAAEHHLVVDFHGAYKPTGVSRTLPNMITREGVLGNEYNKWSDLITPRHTVVLPYTRGLLGEMDFTPGGFNHVQQEDFVPVGGDAPNPTVMGTRCHQLAMLVVYESAFAVICDSPYNYKDQPGTDFLKKVPTTWSETRYVKGYPGEDIVLARRSGDRWYVGGMTNEEARRSSFVLDFLENGSYQAVIWRDAGDAGEYPAHLVKETQEFNAGDSFTISMERGGGFVMILEPLGSDN